MKNIKIMKHEEAVSPVIGVILMVVITVILAAVLAVFAFGVGAPTKAPQASLEFAIDSGTITVTHSGGDPIVANQQKITIVYANDTKIFAKAGVTTLANISAVPLSQFLSVTTLAPGTAASNITLNSGRGDIFKIMVMDVPSGQFITSAQVSAS